MRKSIRRLVIKAGLLFVVLPLCLAVNIPNGQAASFDCAKATTRIEKMICADAELSKLDEELAAAYKAALQDENQAVSIRQAQKQWIKERNSCAEAACVKTAYENRFSSLHSIAHASTVPTAVDSDVLTSTTGINEPVSVPFFL